jgi:hypothetical protein
VAHVSYGRAFRSSFTHRAYSNGIAAR